MLSVSNLIRSLWFLWGLRSQTSIVEALQTRTTAWTAFLSRALSCVEDTPLALCLGWAVHRTLPLKTVMSCLLSTVIALTAAEQHYWHICYLHWIERWLFLWYFEHILTVIPLWARFGICCRSLVLMWLTLADWSRYNLFLCQTESS